MSELRITKHILSVSIVLFLIISTFRCNTPTGPAIENTHDTTSNNFTFQTFTFGASNAGSSYLKDVAIISDSNIWCVGAVYLDSVNGAPDPFPYNVLHWNGKEWKTKKISVEYKGHKTIVPLTGIFDLSDGNIILSSGLPYLPDGNGGWKLYQLWDMGVLNQNDGSVYHIWGTSLDDLYFVGNSGTIVHYQNGTWQKIESGTDMNIYDIWGIEDKTGKEEILAVASYPDTSAQRKIFQINGTSAKEISSKGINWDLESVWFIPDSQYFVAGSGIYQKNLLSDSLWRNSPRDITKYYTNCIRGNGVNDIAAVGAFGEVLHYNGVRWKSFINQTELVRGEYLSVAVKGNEIVTVGYDGNKAVVTVGKR